MTDDPYARGADLGCPDCIAGEMHCCPFLWADTQPPARRAWAVRHMHRHLADEIEHARTAPTRRAP